MSVNCDELPGRLRDLCRGHDDSGNPILTHAKRKAYRQYFHGGEHAEHQRLRKLTAEQREADRLQRSQECWRQLHAYAVEHWDDWDEDAARKWLIEWEATIPRYGCACRKHWRGIKRDLPPVFRSAKCFFQWSVAAHNAVNESLGKPIMSQEQAWDIYWPAA